MFNNVPHFTSAVALPVAKLGGQNMLGKRCAEKQYVQKKVRAKQPGLNYFMQLLELTHILYVTGCSFTSGRKETKNPS